MLRLTRSQLQQYGVAVLAVVVALLLTQLLWALLKPTLYPLFLAAVMVSSWYGGIGPGLVTTALSTLTCIYFFLLPLYSLLFSRSELLGLLQFVLVALLISLLNSALRSAQQQAESSALSAQRNYERLHQTQEILRESEERYRLLVEGVTDYAIFMLDKSGHFISWNVGAERILGYQEAEIIGQPFSYIFASEAVQRGQPEQVLRQTLAEGFSKENRWHVRKDGTQLWSHCMITPLQDENGNLRGFAKIMQDITQRQQIEEERQQLLVREQAARAEAEAANRSKDEFLAIVSHELRTPLTAILGWAGILHAGKLDEVKSAIAVETIERNANLQMQLIEDLLDISRIIRGELSLNFDWVDLIQVIQTAIETVQPAADAKAINLGFSITDFSFGDTTRETETVTDQKQPNYPSVFPSSQGKIQHSQLIWGDLERLQQVVWNLLSNAIKFTPEAGNVTLRLFLEAERQDSLLACIQVSDTGKGISADFLPYVFERFRQGNSKSTRSHKGLGLGLAIARHLVELHGGTINVESPGIGQGTTFTVKLPLLKASRRQEDKESSEVSSSLTPQPSPLTLEGLQVLVVDDEVDTLEWLSTVLQQSGAQVIAVASVEEALEALENLKPDVLVSDIGMPGEDGYALIGKIRELAPEMGGRIPAVALTAYASVEDYRKALSEGFQLHVAKPVRAGELIAVVTSLGRMTSKL